MNKGNKYKRKKSYYVQFKKRQKQNTLTTGIRGFVLTCNAQEKPGIREGYNILNEYADKMYGPEKIEDEVKEGDIEASLENELQVLQEKAKEPRRFQQVFTGIQSCLFVQTQLEDPCGLILSILEDLKSTQKQKTKYLMRIVPTLVTCKPYVDKIELGIVEAIDLFLKSSREYREKEKVLYMIVFRARNNNSLQKNDVVNAINSSIRAKDIGWEAELQNPDIVISVDVLNVVCCLGFMPGYLQYKKYNLLEVAKGEIDKTDAKPKDATDQPSSTGTGKEGIVEKTAEHGKLEVTNDANKSSAKISSQVAKGQGDAPELNTGASVIDVPKTE